MVRGQGKTEGYHERIIPLHYRTVRALGSAAGAGDIGKIASDRIEQIGIVQRILSHSIQVFVAHGDPEQIGPADRALALPWLNRLDDIVDAHFFDALQTELEAREGEREGIRNAWLRELKSSAEDLLHDAENTLPCPAIHRYRARVRADGLFAGRMRGPKGLPFLFAEATGEASDDDHAWGLKRPMRRRRYWSAPTGPVLPPVLRTRWPARTFGGEIWPRFAGWSPMIPVRPHSGG